MSNFGLRTDISGLFGAFTRGTEDVMRFGGADGDNSGQLAGFRNKLINCNFEINQLNVSGTVTLTAGQYGHDGFKAGAAGCTYTFTTVAGITTLTITAGTLVQIANGKYLKSGIHTLGWNGTAQGRIDTGAYAVSPISGTAVAGTNQSCEWGIGTLSLPQYEPGSIRTAFEFRDDELQRCRKYYRYNAFTGIAVPDAAGISVNIDWSGMNSTPVKTLYGGAAEKDSLDSIRKTASGVLSSRANTLLFYETRGSILVIYTIAGWSPALVVGSNYDFGLELSARL